MTLKRFSVVVGLSAMLVAPCAHAVSYTFVDLHPAGYSLSYGEGGIAGGQQVGYGLHVASATVRALLWSGTADSVVDLHPAGYDWSNARGVDGVHQVGYGPYTASGAEHALLWAGSAGSVVDLHPSGYESSEAWGVSGVEQVGFGMVDSSKELTHALLWRGNASSVVDLHPDGYFKTQARRVAGGQQVGWGTHMASGEGHALVWSGTADSALSLHPIDALSSAAYGLGDGQQVGQARVREGVYSATHAALWSGSPESFVDLHPDGYNWSLALNASAGKQVGYGGNVAAQEIHALVWSGSADSAVDLHDYAPSDTFYSYAVEIDPTGTVLGSVWTFDAQVRACMWVPQSDVIPEPTTLSLFALGGLALLRRRRKRWPLATTTHKAPCPVTEYGAPRPSGPCSVSARVS